VVGRVAGRFARVEPRRRAKALVRGLLADLPRKNCWRIAEHAGQASPDGMQHLLARAVWDADAVRDDVRGLLVEHLGDPGAVLVVDETGDLKKGTRTVGVKRQDTGTAGKVDNAQVAVYLAYATTAGHAEGVPAECWLRVSAGHGAKGRRWYAWTRLPLDGTGAPPGWQRWLLVRRSRRTGSWPTTCAPAQPACRRSPWSGWPGRAGGWRRRSRPARACAAWTSTRSAAGAAGTGG
jgi:hypothetical protein